MAQRHHHHPQLYDEPINVPIYEARLSLVQPCLVSRLFIHMRMVDRDLTYFLYRRGRLPDLPSPPISDTFIDKVFYIDLP
jgi:hypothetical protein